MVTALGLAEAVWRAAPLTFKQAWKPLGRVKIEMFLGYNTLNAQKVLDTFELNGRVNNQPFAAYKQKLKVVK